METPISPKVIAGGLAGAVTAILVYVISLFGVELPPEVASAVTVIITAVFAYLKTDPLRVPDGTGTHRAVPGNHVG